MQKITFYLVVLMAAFGLYLHVVPQVAEWRYYEREKRAAESCTRWIRVNGEYNTQPDGGHWSYSADFMWSRLEFDFYSECI